MDLAKNAITKVPQLPQLTKLEEIWMNDNQVTDLDEVRHLATIPSLKTIYLERNPMHGLGNTESEARYKEAILQAAPNLYQLDAVRLKTAVKVVTDGKENNVIGIRKR